MPRTNSPNAGLPIARHGKRSASARALQEKSYVELLTCLEMSTGHFSTGANPNRWAKAAIDEGVEVVTWDK